MTRLRHIATSVPDTRSREDTTHFEEKSCDPDGIIFDISGHGWAGTAEWNTPQSG